MMLKRPRAFWIFCVLTLILGALGFALVMGFDDVRHSLFGVVLLLLASGIALALAYYVYPRRP
jgi:hypothetical protein